MLRLGGDHTYAIDDAGLLESNPTTPGRGTRGRHRHVDQRWIASCTEGDTHVLDDVLVDAVRLTEGDATRPDEFAPSRPSPSCRTYGTATRPGSGSPPDHRLRRPGVARRPRSHEPTKPRQQSNHAHDQPPPADRFPRRRRHRGRPRTARGDRRARTTEPPIPPIAVEELTRIDEETLVRGAVTDNVTASIRIAYEGMDELVIDMPDLSHIAVARITVQPGAQFPWHSHPGPVLVTVTQGELVYVMADDCMRAHVCRWVGVRRSRPRQRAHRVQSHGCRDGDRRDVHRDDC